MHRCCCNILPVCCSYTFHCRQRRNSWAVGQFPGDSMLAALAGLHMCLQSTYSSFAFHFRTDLQSLHMTWYESEQPTTMRTECGQTLLVPSPGRNETRSLLEAISLVTSTLSRDSLFIVRHTVYTLSTTKEYISNSTCTWLVEAAFCQPAETYEMSYCYVCLLLYHRHCFCNIWYGQIITLSLFTLRRRVARSANSRHCTTVCEVTAVEGCISCGSRRYIEVEIVCCSSHGYSCRLRLYTHR